MMWAAFSLVFLVALGLMWYGMAMGDEGSEVLGIWLTLVTSCILFWVVVVRAIL